MKKNIWSQTLMKNEIQALNDRSNCYKLLAACFYEIKKNLFDEEMVLHNLCKILQKICPDSKPLYKKLQKAYKESSEKELLVQYAKLFVGPFELLAPPYGSVYLEETKRVMGASTLSVIEFYESEGLKIDKEYKDLPDHITAELEFMYYLIYKELEASAAEDTESASRYKIKQREFFTKLLLPWVLDFAQKIKQNSENLFYQSLAECLTVFILSETAVYKDELNKIQLNTES